MFRPPLPFRGGAGGGDCQTLHRQTVRVRTAPTPTPPLKGRGFRITTLLLAALPVTVQAQEMDPNMPGMDHSEPKADAFGCAGDCEYAARPPRPAAGSGTSRLPGNEGAMHGLHIMPGDNWMVMLHASVSTQYTKATGPRGDDKFYVPSMAMAMAENETSFVRVQIKSMMSLEPLMSNRGYPNLFATGETAGGQPLVDHQHPHDLLMELAGRVDVTVSDDVRAFVYGGPVGEPALGPSAFMHRGSAKANPEPPITHHWFDSTHITYGVATAGIATDTLQVEASLFTGREPDERRWNIEKPRFDSWSVRATWTPSPAWALQISHGRLKQPEFLTHPGENENRTTASVHFDSGAGLSAMAAFSAKKPTGGDTSTAWLAEANWDLSDHHTLFGRFENVRNGELFPDSLSPLHDQPFRVGKLQAGYAYRLPIGDSPFNLAVGGAVSTYFKPPALDVAYGQHPVSVTVFAKLSLGH